MRVDLETTLPSQFVFTEDRDYADYIYLKSDLSTLTGKKFQSKRNHINRFRNTYPDYEYAPISPDRIQECLDLSLRHIFNEGETIEIDTRDGSYVGRVKA